MLSLTPNELRPRAEKLAAVLRANPVFRSVEIRDDSAFVGGGSLPDLPLPTVLVAVVPRDLSDAVFAERLRSGSPAVMARVQEGRVLFDLRTVFHGQDGELSAAIATAAK
jgi:L-seryl-tRNA(Ser) seleniumtransferase